jgi:hypothetical protein
MNGLLESQKEDRLLAEVVAEHPDWTKAAIANEAMRRAGHIPPVSDEALTAGMGQMPYWLQGHRNYLDLALAIRAAVNANHGIVVFENKGVTTK